MLSIGFCAIQIYLPVIRICARSVVQVERRTTINIPHQAVARKNFVEKSIKKQAAARKRDEKKEKKVANNNIFSRMKKAARNIGHKIGNAVH